MLEENTSVFFVDANGILDGLRCTGAVDERCVHVVDGTLAVAAKAQAVGHVASTILTQIKSMLPLVRVLRIAVRYNHLREGQAPENRPYVALVVESDIAQDDTLAIVEANVNTPVLPVDNTAINFERDAFRLGDVDGLQVCSKSSFCLNGGCMIVVRRCLVEWSSYFWNIDVYDLVGICVENWAEVQGEGVLAIINVRPVVHQSLLKPDLITKALVEANCPG